MICRTVAFVFVSSPEEGEGMVSRLLPVVVGLLGVCEMVGGCLNIVALTGVSASIEAYPED